MKIKVAGIDPALAAFGMAKFSLDLTTMGLEIEDLQLIKTEKLNKKLGTRQNSDDLRRSFELNAGFKEFIGDCTVGFAEIPSGAQHARSAFGFGMVIGILGSMPIPLIEVMPLETKQHSVGSRTAGKPEIIAWATSLYPSGPWLRARGKADGKLVDANEHIADACAVVHAGLQTPEFKRLIAIWKASSLTH